MAVLLILVIAAVALVANALLAQQYTPAGAVSQYLGALRSGDTSAAWSAIQVSVPAGAAKVSFLDEASLRSALSAWRPDYSSFNISATNFLDPNQTMAAVDISLDTPAGTRQVEAIVERGADKHLGLYPSWHVLITPSTLEITLPHGSGEVAIDGKRLSLAAGKSEIAILPLVHEIKFSGSAMLQPQTTRVDAFLTPDQSISYRPTPTAAGEASAKTAVKAAFEDCAKQTSSHPDGCPQRFDNAWIDSGQWRLLGDPTQDLAFSADANGNPIASGHYQMVFTWQESGVDGIQHFPSAGGYQASLAFTPTDAAVRSVQAVESLAPLTRPAAATDQAVKDAVASGFTTCAALKSGTPADCPQQYFFVGVTSVSWTVNGDPLSGATISFDSKSGFLVVHGSFEMTAAYD
ncbi:MAG: hypothetical protein ACREOM_10055, partial [Candidatus Dormibacteraceae bacterium]